MEKGKGRGQGKGKGREEAKGRWGRVKEGDKRAAVLPDFFYLWTLLEVI